MGKVMRMEVEIDSSELNHKSLERVVGEAFGVMGEGGVLVITRGPDKPSRFDAARFLRKLTGGEGRLRKLLDAWMAAPGGSMKLEDLRRVALAPGMSPSPYRISGQLSSLTRNVLKANGERSWFTWEKVGDDWYYTLKPEFAEAIRKAKQ
jgi:hypothetical protein